MQIKLEIECPVEKATEVMKAVSLILVNHNVNFDLTQKKKVPEITCLNDMSCGWSGDVVELRVNKAWRIGCPKCGRAVKRSDFGLSPTEWADLPIAGQVLYTLVTGEGDEFDIDVTWAEPFNSPTCETCEVTHVGQALYGTSDSREPKWCIDHYLQINRASRFVKKGV